MKALFSTTYLANQLEKALTDKGFDKIEFGDDEWVFNCAGNNLIGVSVSYTRDSSRALEILYIDRSQWYKLLQFLKLLPEQPIVLEISDFGDDDVKLRLSQFIADFD